jgi:hypothetical protein
LNGPFNESCCATAASVGVLSELATLNRTMERERRRADRLLHVIPAGDSATTILPWTPALDGL